MQVILLSVVVFCSAHVKSTTYKDDGNDVVIFRGEKDRFTRKIACNESKAVCFNESCTYCQCTEGQTFVRSRGRYGECVSNELLVYATSEYFLLDNYPHQFCLAYKHGGNVDFNFVNKMLSCNRENWKQRWIWTKHKQLLNWESLECMTDDYTSTVTKRHFLRMKRCNRKDQKQLWNCERQNIKQTQSGRYMYYGQYHEYVTTRNISWDVASQWARYDSGKKQVCSQAVGCETFADGSSIVILNKTKCEENLEYSGEKEIELGKTSCSLLPHKFEYLHNDTWKPLGMKNGSFAMATRGKVSLKWNLKGTPKSWEGLMVKIQFKCEDTSGSNITETEHCVVVKYTGHFKGFHGKDGGTYCDGEKGGSGDGKDGNGDEAGDGKNGDSDKNGDGGDKESAQTDKNKINVNQESNGDDKDNSKTIIIIVCVLVVLILAGVVVFIMYRYRNSHGRTQSNNGNEASQDQNQAPEVSTRNQPTHRDSRTYEVPSKRPYLNYAFDDLSLRNNRKESMGPKETGGYVIERPNDPPYELPHSAHEYEYPDLSQSHQYEYPSINKKADIAGRTDISTDGDGYSALLRPPLNRNESENGGYTSLIKGRQTSENSGTAGKEDDAGDRSSYVVPNDGNYTPLVRTPLKDNESETPRYEHLLTNGQRTPKKPM